MKGTTILAGAGLGLGMTAVGFATWGVLSTGAASASTAGLTAPLASAPASAPASTSPSAMASAPASVPASAPASAIPTAPPVTGGGGTAGLQDAVLFGIGGAAVLVGAGSVAYRVHGRRRT